MSNPKFKSENYEQFGGINNKFSPYLTTPLEFLDILNFDFQTPGSLTQRWGSTQYASQTFVGKITSLTEFSRLDGTSMVIAGATGALAFGATTGTFQGLSFIGQSAYQIPGNNNGAGLPGAPYYFDVGYFGATVNAGPVGGSFLGAPYFGNWQMKIGLHGASFNYSGHTLSGNYFSFAAQNNFLFGANGSQFFKFDGASTSFVGLPPLIVSSYGLATGASGIRVNNSAGATEIGVGASGSYGFYGSFVNSRGYEGQIWPIMAVNAGQATGTSLGGTFITGIQTNIFLPSQYDVASVNIYSYWSSATLSIGQTTFWNNPYVFQKNVPISGVTIFSIWGSTLFPYGQTIMPISLGSTTGGVTHLTGNLGTLPDQVTNLRFALGFTAYITSFVPGEISNVQINPFIPRFLETYQNRLFCAGFSSAPSTVWFSDLAEPEGFRLDSNFEVRTNDADVLRGMKVYTTKLYLFKRESFHALSGDNPNNFDLQEVSHEFGLLNNRSVVVFNNLMAFLDRKGVILYDGANVQHLSSKVQPYFDRMNFAAGVTNACMVHDKLRNQILCAIPIDGATLNNITMVYDYVANAWTTSKGVAPSVLAAIQGYNNTRNAFYGSYSGTINWYGASFANDNGAGVSLYFKTRFLKPMGESTEEQYRRAYLNADAPASTLMIPVNFYQDYGSSIVLQSTFIMGAFQDRIDFGLPAKSLAFEIATMSQTSPLRIHGFTIESRMQRKT
jgi:hypothetical protein